MICAIDRCHGEKNNAVYELAKHTDLLARSGDLEAPKQNFIRSNGEEIPIEISTKLFKLFADIYEGEAFIEQTKSYHGSRGNFWAEK